MFILSITNRLFLSMFLLLFALTLSAQTSDIPNYLYKWGVTNNGSIKKEKSKAYPGYIVFKDGKKVDGDLQLKKINGKLKQLNLDMAGRELKLEPHQVDRYGLYIKPAYFVPKDGKPHYAAGKNFSPGTVTMLNGEVRRGYVAFRQSLKMRSDQFCYDAVLFAPGMDEQVSYLSSIEIDNVSQNIAGKTVQYEYLNGRFVSIEALMIYASFSPGEVVLKNGRRTTGQISLYGRNHAEGVYFLDENKQAQFFNAVMMQAFSIVWEGRNIRYRLTQGVYSKEEQDLGTHLLYRNPFPTTENKTLGGLRDLAGTVATAVVVNEVAKGIAKKNGVHDKASQRKLENASPEELAEYQTALDAMAESLAKDPGNEELKRKLGAKRLQVRMMIANQKSIPENLNKGGATIFKKEWILLNKATGTEVVVLKNGFKSSIKPTLESCSSYMMLTKREQKQLLKWENLAGVAQLLNECQ